jgi:hypothetical protein
MSLTIWTQCGGDKLIVPQELEAHRVVENQFNSSTRKLVDSLPEHDLLEQMIEEGKPPRPEHTGPDRPHYLMYTPFRYLPRLSRFNTLAELPLWYGAHRVETALAEKSFHTICFLEGSPDLTDPFEARWTSFRASIKTNNYVDLTRSEFESHHSAISNPVTYRDSQPLGASMRAGGIEAFSFQSARDPSGKNVGVFTLNAFSPKAPIEEEYRGWIAYVTRQSITIYRVPGMRDDQITFTRHQFIIDGVLPHPTAA